MSPERHKRRILRYMTIVRNEVCTCLQEGHIRWPPKSLREVEADIESVLREIERTDFMKGTTNG